MKWADYREKLGIGFNDEQKYFKLKNKINIIIEILCDKCSFKELDYFSYCLMVGEPFIKYTRNNYFDRITNSLFETNNTKELVSKYIALCNTYSNNNGWADKEYKKEFLINFIKTSLNELNIPFDLIEDEDGIFIFPKGVQELDEALVNQPLDWLKDYPLTQKAFITALKEYSNCTPEKASYEADNFRKALETFFQEFFKGGKTLENYKSEYGTYLKDNGVPAEISRNLQTLLEAYTNFNNNYAKHHDKTSLNVLEYIMYQTGNIIRLLITLKNNSK